MLTATDAHAASVKGSASVAVQAGTASKLVLSGPTTVKAGTAAVYTVTALDAFGNVATGYRGTVSWQSSDLSASLPPAYTFKAADAGSHTFSVTFVVKKSQSLSVTDSGSPPLKGSESGIVVT